MYSECGPAALFSGLALKVDISATEKDFVRALMSNIIVMWTVSMKTRFEVVLVPAAYLDF